MAQQVPEAEEAVVVEDRESMESEREATVEVEAAVVKALAPGLAEESGTVPARVAGPETAPARGRVQAPLRA